MRKPRAQEAFLLSPGGWSGQPSSLRQNVLQSSHPAPERDIDHGVGQRAGNFMAASRVPGLEHCIIQFVGQHPYPLHQFFFKLLSEFVGCYAGRGNPLHPFLLSELVGYYAGRCHSQDNKGDLTVSLATAWHIKVGELWLMSQGIMLFSSDPPVLADCVVNIPKCLDGVPLTAEVLTHPVETLSPFSRPFCQRGL